jgi:intron-binding protein aquarius
VRNECSMNSWISSSSKYSKRQHIIARADVIAMTVAGACLRRFSFRDDCIIGAMVIEEAAKMTQPEAVAVLSYKPERVLMVGDPLQLAPVIKSEKIRQRTRLDISLFERLLSHTSHITLNQQGRARPELCDLYRWRYSNLIDLPSVLGNSEQSFTTGIRPILDFIDVAMGNVQDEVCKEEGFVIEHFVHWLINVCQILPTNISVITPYRSQRAYLSNTLSSFNLGHVATIDEYQGLQNDIIIISLVHRGQQGPSSFLKSQRRINVMTSRAKKSTYFFGRKLTYENSNEWKEILKIIANYQSSLSEGVLKSWRAIVCECVHSSGMPVKNGVTKIEMEVEEVEEVEEVIDLWNLSDDL